MRGFPLPAVILLLVAPALLPGAPAVSVTTETTALSQALVGTAALYAEGQTFVFGGRYGDGTYAAQVLTANLPLGIVNAIDTFTSGGNVEAAPGRYSGAAAVLGTKIYYFGGAQLVEMDLNGDNTKESVPKASNDIFELDLVTGDLKFLGDPGGRTGDKLPYPAFGQSAVAAGGKIFLFGGFEFDISNPGNIRRHNDIVVFDPSKTPGSRVRTGADALPYNVQDAAAALVGAAPNPRILIMGGLSDHDDNANPCPTYTKADGTTGQPKYCLTKRIVSFDPASELVRGVAGELPYRVQFARAAVVANKAYVPGGLLSDGTPTASIVEVALESSGRVAVRTLTPTLPVAAYGQGVASDGQNLIVVGGRKGAESDLLTDIIRIDPRATAPWAPRSATATEITGGVRLSWEAPAYNGDSSITGYRIYRSTIDGTNETKIADTAQLSYEDFTTKPGVEYVWRVTAVNAAGESAQGARITRTASTAVPGAVVGFQADPGDVVAALKWQPPTETGGSNITGYRILRDAKILSTVGPGNTSFEDRAVTNGATYAYQVRAYNARGDGALSGSIIVTPAPVPPPPTGILADVKEDASGTSSVQLSWIAPNAPVQRYHVYRTTSLGVAPALVGDASTTSFADTAVERGRTYYYTVRSENDVGTSPPSPDVVVSLVRKPGMPTDVVALGLEGEVRVSWQPPADTGDAPNAALRYYVSRAGGGSSREIIVKTDIDGTTYADRTVTPGQTYTYKVTTLNPMPSDPSDAVSAVAKAVVNKPPVALLAILPSVAAAGEPVELDASQSTDPDGAIRRYVFDFGDGTQAVQSSTPTVTHAYERNGTFTATVLVTDDRNTESAIASARIVVGELEGGEIETGLPGTDPGKTNETPTKQPGSDAPKLPGPASVLVALVVAGAALLVRRRA